MKTRNTILVCFLLLAAKMLTAQSFDVPKNVVLKDKDDYAKYEKDIINAAIWLRDTPLNEQEAKRKEVSQFVILWLTGSPTVDVELGTAVLDFEKKNTGMMVVFMAASARYSLENNYSKDKTAKNRAALLDLITVYKSGKGISKDKKMDKLVKMEAEGKLDEWIKENM